MLMQTKLPTDSQVFTVQLLFSLEPFNKDANKTAATYVVNDGLAASWVSADRGTFALVAHTRPIPSRPGIFTAPVFILRCSGLYAASCFTLEGGSRSGPAGVFENRERKSIDYNKLFKIIYI
jgi:hypothetical protein